MNNGPADGVPLIKPEHNGDGKQVHSMTAVLKLMGVRRQQVAIKGKPQEFIIKAQ